MRKRIIAPGIILLAAWLCAGICLAAENTCPEAFRLVARLSRGAAVPLYQKASLQANVLLRIPGGKSCEVLGQSGAYYKVRYQGKTGYISRDRAELQGKQSGEKLPEIKQTGMGLENHIPREGKAHVITLKGTIRSTKPLDAVSVFLWDERQLKVEKAYLISFKTPKTSVSGRSLQSKLSLERASAGRKTVVVQGYSGGKQYRLFRTLLCIRGEAKEPAGITGQCTVSVPALTDQDAKTVWEPGSRHPAVTVDIPAGAQARLLTIDWKARPETFTIELRGEKQKLLSRETLNTDFYVDHYALNDSVRSVRITVTGKRAAMNALRVYGKKYDTHSVQTWQSLTAPVDILFFSTHQDDELLFFGGGIPYYSALGKQVAVVYATDNGRSRYREAMEGLWAAGLKYHPVFLGWHNFKARNVKGALADWNARNGDVQKKLVRLLRRLQPQVVVTQGFDGEYGHPQHKAGVQLMAKALKLAADEQYDPESVRTYGTWQVKKMYAHRYEKNRITMNWNVPLDEEGVVTPLFLAKEAFDRHRTQQRGFSIETTSRQYDCTQFGLYYTAVGPDVKKNDFLENIP